MQRSAEWTLKHIGIDLQAKYCSSVRLPEIIPELFQGLQNFCLINILVCEHFQSNIFHQMNHILYIYFITLPWSISGLLSEILIADDDAISSWCWIVFVGVPFKRFKSVSWMNEWSLLYLPSNLSSSVRFREFLKLAIAVFLPTWIFWASASSLPFSIILASLQLVCLQRFCYKYL